MFTIYSDDHRLHHGKAELNDGQLMPCHEKPERADSVLAAIQSSAVGDVIEPADFGLEPVLAVHTAGYIDFLQNAWSLWAAEGRDWDALPLNWPVRGMRQVEPDYIDGKLSYYSFDAGTPITPGTWQAVFAGARVALTGAAKLLSGEKSVFSLCRPPGHHAAADYFGGYCYLNNAAIAAQYLRDNGAGKVAVLDVDYHHGNGTQSIFYDRDDVLFVSIHGDPKQEFPYFLGHADETGEGPGEGFNMNLPLPWNTSAADWFTALDESLERLSRFGPDAVVVSLGVDTYINDPISQFQLQAGDYLYVGQKIAKLGLPAHYVFEGGYAVEDIGENVVNVLRGAGGG
ncbi:MAG: histone deacetylase family protein [Woeseiaceae bacterium]|nr:histone deacetylase family protein [Woeseiaceae bacterium]